MAADRLESFRGEWALVTGASAGMGREFCRALAKGNINLVMVARRKDLLDQLSEELTKSFGVQCLSVDLDLTENTAAEKLKSVLRSKGISPRVVINNAGMGRWGRFESSTYEQYEKVLKLNNLAMVALCHAFLEDLLKHSTSVIINVSSQAALQPIPYMAVYAASKAFVHNFSQALYEEYRERGLYVQTFVPGPTRTEFDQLAGSYESGLTNRRDDPDKVVAVSLKHLNSHRPVVSSVPIFKQKVLSALVPAKILVKEVGKIFRPPKA